MLILYVFDLQSWISTSNEMQKVIQEFDTITYLQFWRLLLTV